MKTNKSFTKRLRVTKNGKIVSRGVGVNHFNAKESGSSKRGKGRAHSITMNARQRRQFLPRSK
jgi:ribosomal protein L35